MVLNIIGLSEEKDCDQKILNLVDSLSKDIGIILASQLELKEAEYLHCIKYRTQEFIGKTYFIKINVGDANGEKKSYFINLKISVYCDKPRLDAVQLCQTEESPIHYF